MKLNIKMDGKTYEVKVDAAEPEPPAAAAHNLSGLNGGSSLLRVPAAASPAAPAADSKLVNEEKVCSSPVSGIVARVARRIAAIGVNQGDGVQAGQLVVEFE